MIEQLKYRLLESTTGKQMRVRAIAFLTALTVAVITLLNCSIHTVKIFDGEKTYTVRSLNNNVASVLDGLELKSKRYKIKKTSVKDRVTTVEIAYTFPVYVTQGDVTKKIEFSHGTVADALSVLGITPDEFDFVEPSLDTEITKTVYIDYTNIDYINGSYTETIAHTVNTVYSSSMKKGTSTLKAGSDGVQLVNYTEKLVNGVSVEKTVSNTSIITAAVNGVKTIGTKAETVQTSVSVSCISTLTPSSPIELDQNGVPVNYKSKMTVRATAYTYTGNNCSTGVAPQPGYIAVNPKVIPYGTKMYIKTVDGKYIYGYAVAADTGGFIKKHPTGVDLFFPTESACRAFGVRSAEIYILN